MTIGVRLQTTLGVYLEDDIDDTSYPDSSPTGVPAPFVTPTPTPVVTPVPSPVPEVSPSVNTVYIRAVRIKQERPIPVENAKVVVIKTETQEQWASGFTSSDGYTPTWEMPANTNVTIYLYPPSNTKGCGDSKSFSTGAPGTSHFSLMQIKEGEAEIPCIKE